MKLPPAKKISTTKYIMKSSGLPYFPTTLPILKHPLVRKIFGVTGDDLSGLLKTPTLSEVEQLYILNLEHKYHRLRSELVWEFETELESKSSKVELERECPQFYKYMIKLRKDRVKRQKNSTNNNEKSPYDSNVKLKDWPLK